MVLTSDYRVRHEIARIQAGLPVQLVLNIVSAECLKPENLLCSGQVVGAMLYIICLVIL